jgi:hypothetical protein
MEPFRHDLQVSPEALEHIAAMRLPGAQLSTLLALLARLDQTGAARITQAELTHLLGSGPGRVWQSLRALAEAGVIYPPKGRRGYGRRTPYRIPVALAIAPNRATPKRSPKVLPRRGDRRPRVDVTPTNL